MARHYRLALVNIWYVVVVCVSGLAFVAWRAAAAIEEISFNTMLISGQMQELMSEER